MALPPAVSFEPPDPDHWVDLSRQMAEELHGVIWTSPTGEALRSFLETQSYLITSIPLEAARRAQSLALEQLSGNQAGVNIVDELLRIAHITRGRAELIARTEVARASSALTMVRAISVGSEGYIWRTARDSLVRKEHKPLEGRFIRWDKPPKAMANGTRAHAGMCPNCRCYPEPVIPGKASTRFRAY